MSVELTDLARIGKHPVKKQTSKTGDAASIIFLQLYLPKNHIIHFVFVIFEAFDLILGSLKD